MYICRCGVISSHTLLLQINTMWWFCTVVKSPTPGVQLPNHDVFFCLGTVHSALNYYHITQRNTPPECTRNTVPIPFRLCATLHNPPTLQHPAGTPAARKDRQPPWHAREGQPICTESVRRG